MEGSLAPFPAVILVAGDPPSWRVSVLITNDLLQALEGTNAPVCGRLPNRNWGEPAIVDGYRSMWAPVDGAFGLIMTILRV
ncbi:MAG: hypothetical protein NZ578_08440, partial [Candidatus Binatia bacterium]|nr:hypothetical protein [Candidatus Binatia bacterium]